MSFSGLDLEAVLKHARTLETEAAGRLFDVITSMQGIVPQLMDNWKGADANQFQQQWAHHHQMLTNLHATLTEVARNVAVAAQQQAETSGR